jgi:N4-gp56 family major capsid protein
MADYVVNLTGSAQVDDSIVEEFAQQVLISHNEIGTADQFVSLRTDVGAKSIEMPLYDRLSVNTTPLNEREEVASKALSDSPVLLTPAEYGDVVTKTALSSIQTGGKVDMAAAQLVGINMAQTQNKLALLAADASANVLTAGDKAVGSLLATDVLTGTMANKVYNKLARRSVPGLPTAMGHYVAIAHDDVLNDIRGSVGFEDIKKYHPGGADDLSKNIIGFYKGFLWVRDNLATIAADAGDTNVDVYNTYFLGFNGLGKGTSLDAQLRLTGPFDKLARFVNIGWYGVFKYGIIQPEAIWVGKSASSVGANA